MKHTWYLCGELRKAKSEIWSWEVGFEKSDQIEIERLNDGKANNNKIFLLGKIKKWFNSS
jgi:hypothetical protein